MKKQLRVICVHRRFDGRHRRLMFEQCEERLALSGSSIVPVDAAPLEGGFIALDAGDYLSTASNTFLDADSLGSLFRFDGIAFSTISGANDDSAAWSSSNPISTFVVGKELTVRRVDGVTAAHPDVDVSLFSVDETVLPSADITGENGSTGGANGGSESILVDAVGDGLGFEPSGASTGTTFSGTTDAVLSTHVDLSVVVVHESLPTTEAVDVLDATKTPLESIAVIDEPGEVSEDDARELPVWSVQSVIGNNGIRIELPSPEGGDAFTYSEEGGPIEVARAVVETQQAFEAQVFSAVAVLLDNENILAQPTPPVRLPFSGELARSVAFETMGLDETADSAHSADSHAPSAALPASSVGAAISASAAAADVKEADIGPSRALAFAQWPLVFSATLGAVLAGSRWRSQSGAVQLPPRRNRQATAP